MPGNKTVEAAGILKKWEPEGKKIVTMNNGVFLILSEPLKNVITNRLISLVNMQLKEQGIEAEVSYTTKTDGPAESFFRSAVSMT